MSEMYKLPKSIFDLINLEVFRKHPYLAIGEKKISLLKSFIDGYFYAVDANDIKIEQVEHFYTFNDWTAEYFGWRESTAGWKNIILQECNGDESKAVDKFFEVFDKFMENIPPPLSP